jgi:hypothetical protein
MSYSISNDVAWREVGGELFVITPDGFLHGVRSEAGLFIWLQLEKGSGRQEILVALCSHFDVAPEEAARDFDEFVTTMVEKGLITLKGE